MDRLLSRLRQERQLLPGRQYSCMFHLCVMLDFHRFPREMSQEFQNYRFLIQAQF